MGDELQASPETDKRVAVEVMGWQHVQLDEWAAITRYRGLPPDGTSVHVYVPRFSSDTQEGLWACRQMEERIKELGLEGVYSVALADYTGCIDAQKQGERDTDLLWRLIHASTLDRCKAALSTCSGLKLDVATAEGSTK